jgi:hypothetical protein
MVRLTIGQTPSPTEVPSDHPTMDPTVAPSMEPTLTPTMTPTAQPTVTPTTTEPTVTPTRTPTALPSSQPSGHPTSQPSRKPTNQPISHPSGQPSSHPSTQPTSHPSYRPCDQCASGTYFNPSCDPQMGDCVTCPAGHTCAGGCSPASPCAAGLYQPYTGQIVCLTCADGFFNVALGQWNCTACPKGIGLIFLRLARITLFLLGHSCQQTDELPDQCPVGTYSIGFQVSFFLFFKLLLSLLTLFYVQKTCSACPAGTYSNAPGASFCNVCPPGNECPGGTSGLFESVSSFKEFLYLFVFAFVSATTLSCWYLCCSGFCFMQRMSSRIFLS